MDQEVPNNSVTSISQADPIKGGLLPTARRYHGPGIVISAHTISPIKGRRTRITNRIAAKLGSVWLRAYDDLVLDAG